MKDKPKFYTFAVFAGCSDKPTKIIEGAVLTFNQAWKRCEILQTRHNNPNIQFV